MIWSAFDPLVSTCWTLLFWSRSVLIRFRYVFSPSGFYASGLIDARNLWKDIQLCWKASLAHHVYLDITCIPLEYMMGWLRKDQLNACLLYLDGISTVWPSKQRFDSLNAFPKYQVAQIRYFSHSLPSDTQFQVTLNSKWHSIPSDTSFVTAAPRDFNSWCHSMYHSNSNDICEFKWYIEWHQELNPCKP